MPTTRKPRLRGRRAPRIAPEYWLWSLGFEAEAEEIEPFIEFIAPAREAEIWSEHGEAILREWRKDNPAGTKPPIQVRLEKAASDREECRRWRETYGEARSDHNIERDEP